MKKAYTKPKFQLIRQDESNKVFFAASTPGTPSLGGCSLGSITKTTGEW